MRSDIRQALDLLEDYLASGFRSNRPALQAQASEPAPQAAEAVASGPAQPPDTGHSPEETADRPAALARLSAEIASCTLCPLSLGRTLAVPGEGPLDAVVMIVGEGPGEEEDRTGRPFIGKAGQYLGTWLKAVGVSRADCFIANCVKCRPPQNREPRPEETGACAPYLDRQIEVVRPKTILCLGRIAAHRLLDSSAAIISLRGKTYSIKGIPLVVTYHPSAVLRDQALRRPVWEDLKLLKTLLWPGRG